jgi:prevent-host-death family protein
MTGGNTLVQAKARLSELLDKVEAGEEVVVTRHGRAVARILSAVHPKQPLPLDDLAAFARFHLIAFAHRGCVLHA